MQPSHNPARKEKGVALLIAIFVLLLISVVAIALLVSSGTETALGANYRASSTVYYAALAGLEEARGRLLPKNPDYFTQGVVPTPFPVGQPVYMVNQLPAETVAPTDSSNRYYDKEYATEFGTQASAVGFTPANSVWNNNAKGIPGPAYKWVRITAATERSLNLDVDSNGHLDSTIPIYYNPAATDSHGNPAPGLILGAGPASAVQVLQITALAALPNGSQKLLQYVVAPTGQNNLSFPAAVTLDGPHVADAPALPFSLAFGGQFLNDGTDAYFYSNGGGCAAGTNPSPNQVYAMGYANNDDSPTNITTAIGSNWGEYKGIGFSTGHGGVPSVGYVGGPGLPSLGSNMQTVGQLNALVGTIEQEADVTLTGPITQSDGSSVLPAAMSATNPMTIVVKGDFTESSFTGTGYGTLLVTGTFTYDQNSSWNGIILVIGKGSFQVQNTIQNGNAGINGAILVAATTDSFGNPLPTLGSPIFNYNAVGNQGIVYSSCWVQYVQAPTKYQVLSFHEIPQS